MTRSHRFQSMLQRSRTWGLRVLCLTLTLQWFAVGALPAMAEETAVTADRRVPKDVFFYLSLRDVKELKSRLPNTLLGQLGQDESLRAFISQVQEKLAEVSREFEADSGVTLPNLLAALHGEIAIAVFRPPMESEIGGVLLVDFGDQEATVQKILERADEESEKRGVKREEEEYEDTRIVTYRYPPAEVEDPDDEEAEKPAPKQFSYFVRDTQLVFGSSMEAIKGVINRWDGTSDDSLAENEVYTTIRETCRDEEREQAPLLTWFMDPLGLMKMAANSAGPAEAGLFFATLPKLGLDKFRGVGGTLDFATGEFDTIHRMLLVIDPSTNGVFNAFEFPEIEHTPPRWVKADVSQYVSANWNLPKALQTVETLVDSFQGPGTFAKLIDQFAQNPVAGQLHLKKDLIDHFTGKFHFVAFPVAQAPASEESDDEDVLATPQQDFLVAWELKNTAAFKLSLTKIAQLAGFPGKVREFQGEIIYEFAPATANEDDEEPGQQAPRRSSTVGLTITEGHLMVASDVRFLEEVMRGVKPGETLAESPAYRQVTRLFPATSSIIGFQKQDEQLETFYNLFRSGILNDAFGDKIEFTSLPPFDTLKRYTMPTGTYARPTPQGALIVSFTLARDASEE